MTQFSIVIPTLNECKNIDLLLTRLFALDLTPNSFEVIFVDDGSTDGTPDKIKAWKHHDNVKLLERTENPDLTASILAGAAIATSKVIVVMDADLSHPPESLPAVVKPVIEQQYDIAIGSRYVPGGSIDNWPWYREWLSRAANWITHPLCDINDATSGFFACRRELIQSLPEEARGYKILLELIMAGHHQTRITEVPIRFSDRVQGESKLSLTHQQIYLQRLVTLAGGTVTINTASRFALVGVLGVCIDVLIFHWLVSQGAGLAVAHILGFIVAATVNYSLNTKWAFRQHHDGCLRWHQFARFLSVSLLALLLRGGVLALLVYVWHMPPLYAIFPAIIATAMVNYLGSAFYVFPNEKGLPSPDIRWRVAAIGVVIFIVSLRLIYFGVAQLIPDETYYWQYAQHMDLSFYDHPPMVAWLIWIGTTILGHNEFGVRISAIICGLIAMGYMYAFAQNMYDKSTAMRTVLLFAILPLGFASGTLMTPDAPLVAAWAATLYYMERALITGRTSAWLGMGIAFGLGLLSKYTLGLLGIAALLFVILDPTARRWLQRPHPYLAATLALLLFSPVIIWNMQNHWASFAFQSTRLLDDGYDFAVHHLIMHIMIMLTPIGFLAAGFALFSRHNTGNVVEHRRRLFVQVFTGLPLFVFFALSTFDLPKFHWTGPIWLAILPTIAWMIGQTDQLSGIVKRLQSAWQPTIIISIFTYALVLHYIVLGIPGIPYPNLITKHYYWRETAAEVEQIAQKVRDQTEKEPIIVGMSKWSVASALAFYTHESSKLDIRSRNFLGHSGAMYDYWQPSQPTNRPIIQIGMQPKQLDKVHFESDIKQSLIQPGSIEHRIIAHHGVPVRQMYYRVSEGFIGR